MITFEDVKRNEEVKTYITKADESLIALGYTEHSFAHVMKVATTAEYILSTLGYPKKDIELAQIACYLHDIGNLINREDHAQSGAILAFRILKDMNASPDEIATVVTAIGNHDESTAFAVNSVAAALILADKTDVRRTRVRNADTSNFDIHDRVNYSVKKSTVRINEEKTEISLSLTIDPNFYSALEYFEIFLGRMILCRKAAEKLGLTFRMNINNQQIL
ncbi:MAG TPA: HD domain-containing protein [Clostridia bacterium]|nr:MAG: phosphodiesterase [Firmicutes bacterium ADurb.Bin146]HOD93755.1 HD domain-containing protein [Clostridia bacterium]